VARGNPKSVEAHRRAGTVSQIGRGRTAAPKLPLLLGGRRPVEAHEHLSDDVRAVFADLAEMLAPILDAADAPIVEAAATMLVRAREAGADIARRGAVLDVERVSRSGEVYSHAVPNPSVKIQREAWLAFYRFAQELGIGPASRARLAAAGHAGRPAAQEIKGLSGVSRLARAAGPVEPA
jgi:P27 family predicted phage terminase small subunit